MRVRRRGSLMCETGAAGWPEAPIRGEHESGFYTDEIALMIRSAFLKHESRKTPDCREFSGSALARRGLSLQIAARAPDLILFMELRVVLPQLGEIGVGSDFLCQHFFPLAAQRIQHVHEARQVQLVLLVGRDWDRIGQQAEVTAL